jgi:hypothetical protein
MGFDKENVITAKRLQDGEVCLVQGFGQSMTPIIKSAQICEVAPVNEDTVLEKGDVVFAKVNGRFYLHKISGIRNDQYQISNNHGHVNGWTNRRNIYGKVTQIL